MPSGFRPPELSLRTRLVLAVVVLAAVGLAVLSFVSYRALHSYLYDRVDQQLQGEVQVVSITLFYELQAAEGAGTAFPGDGGGFPRAEGGEGGPGGPGSLPPGTFGQLRLPSGKVLVGKTLYAYGQPGLPKPALPREIEASAPGSEPQPFTVGERGGGSESFRAVAVADPVSGLTTVAAVPLSETNATVDRLALIELVVSAAVLFVLAGGAWWLVGVGLRPLRRMGVVAGEIAAGDLSRRVEPANERTEVGRLGLALNAMLAQIEGAFAERAAGERRLRRFLADASHELRTPLAAIRGYAELYRMGAQREPEQVERAMGRIEAESTRMGGLVDDLLTLARLDEVRAPAQEPLRLDEVLAEACEDARAAAPGRRISLEGGRPVEVVGSDEQLRRVVDNLLRNAVVHTPAGTPIEVSLAEEEDEAVVRIRDHGPGIAAEDPQQVFERFWRSSSSRGREDGGAGLGLAIVAAIVHAHGGSVEAANAAGGGAIFTLRLPLSQGDRAPLSKVT